MSEGIPDRVRQLALDEACRRSFFLFVLRFFSPVGSGELEPNWHHKLLCWEFEKILRGEQRRLLITIAPRTLKSIISSVLFPAWALGHDPRLQIVCASYGLELGQKFARDCRKVMQDPAYRRIFPGAALDQSRTAAHDFATSAGGGRLTVSVGGTFTGLGGDIIICDDLMNAVDASSKVARDTAGTWTQSILRTRLNSPLFGAIVILGQRLHEDDPIGRILDQEHDLWNLIDVPAVAEVRQVFDLGRGEIFVREVDDLLQPARMPLSYLIEQKRALGSAAFSAQYQQRPVPEQGNLVQRKWFKTYAVQPHRRLVRGIFQSWDVAMKTETMNDYSVCVTAAVVGESYRTGDIYILNVLRQKLAYPDLRRAVAHMAGLWSPTNVIIEDKVSGTPLIQDLRAEGSVRPLASHPVGDKLQRLALQSAKIEQGRVFLPASAPWLDDFVTEIIAFPNGRHDDQVDALTQLLGYLDEKARRTMRQSKW